MPWALDAHTAGESIVLSPLSRASSCTKVLGFGHQTLPNLHHLHGGEVITAPTLQTVLKPQQYTLEVRGATQSIHLMNGGN